MRPAYYARLALIIAWQAGSVAAMFYFNSSPSWVTNSFLASALLLPFLGYFVAFYGIPAFANSSRIHRSIVLTILFAVATAGGFYISLFVMFVLFMAFGGHHW